MYSPRYDDPALRSTAYETTDAVLPHLRPEMNCLDLGCGTGTKTLRIAPHVRSVDAIDRSLEMLERLKRRQLETGSTNIRGIHGDNFALPFDSGSYDLCTAFLTTWSAAEAWRVLRDDGLLIIESLHADDKLELKQSFGRDAFGWRGRLLNQSRAAHSEAAIRRLRAFFRIESIKDISFETSLTRDGLIALLETTPTVRDFDLRRDSEIVEQLTQSGSIKFTEHRMMLFARARKEDINYAWPIS